MFEGNDLDILAKRAKEQLKQQAEESTEATPNEPVVDLYAEFREEESNDSVVNSDTYTQKDIELKNKPTEQMELPSLQNEPDDEYDEERQQLFPYDEVLFPDGPTKTQVDSWKKQWTGYDIYAVEVMGQYFVFRTLNRFEYKQLVALQNVDPLQREEIICETVTLWPRKYKWDAMATEKAGIPSTFAQIIMDKSGFTKEYSIQVL